MMLTLVLALGLAVALRLALGLALMPVRRFDGALWSLRRLGKMECA